MSRRSIAKPQGEHLDEIIDAFFEIHGYIPFRTYGIADWAIESGRWAEKSHDLRKELARKIARTCKRRHFRDNQGRLVREMLPAKFEKTLPDGQKILDVVWDHLHTMSDDHFQVSQRQRHDQWLGMGRAMKQDLESYYDNNPNAGEPIQLSLLDMLEDKHTEQVVDVIPIASTNPVTKKRPR
jgi:hypothetical protein